MTRRALQFAAGPAYELREQVEDRWVKTVWPVDGRPGVESGWRVFWKLTIVTAHDPTRGNVHRLAGW